MSLPVKPIETSRATLVDLLDRVLDKGLVINADIIISVAGVPLIGVNLRAALAGMETMVRYGLMKEWDERSRVWERDHRTKKQPDTCEEESTVAIPGARQGGEMAAPAASSKMPDIGR